MTLNEFKDAIKHCKRGDGCSSCPNDCGKKDILDVALEIIEKMDAEYEKLHKQYECAKKEGAKEFAHKVIDLSSGG